MNGSLPQTIAPVSQAEGAASWVDLLKTLADPIRLRIIRLLESHAGLSVGELATVLKLPQSTVSRHLKTLTDAAIAEARREGTSMLYRLADAAGTNSLKQLRSLSRQHLDHDPLARTDAQRLAHVLRQRDDAREKFFGKAAPEWDHIRAQWFGSTFHLEAMLALLNPAWTVADLGTGTGAMLPLLAPHVKQVIAVDPTPAMLKAARGRIRDQHLANVDLRPGTLESLPIDAASVDVALITLVLHHIVEPPAALREVRRILKPAGVLLIVDLQPHAVELFRDKMHHRWMGFSQPQLAAWLTEADFTNLRWHALPSQTPRSKESGVPTAPIPDLFALRAEALPAYGFTTESQSHRDRSEEKER